MKSLMLAAARRLATWWRARRNAGILAIGRDVHIGTGCRFEASRGISVGDQTYIGKEVSIETNAQIGRWVLIANRVSFVGRHDHDYSRIGVPVRFGRWVGGADADPSVAQEGVVVDFD